MSASNVQARALDGGGRGKGDKGRGRGRGKKVGGGAVV